MKTDKEIMDDFCNKFDWPKDQQSYLLVSKTMYYGFYSAGVRWQELKDAYCSEIDRFLKWLKSVLKK